MFRLFVCFVAAPKAWLEPATLQDKPKPDQAAIDGMNEMLGGNVTERGPSAVGEQPRSKAGMVVALILLSGLVLGLAGYIYYKKTRKRGISSYVTMEGTDF